MRVIGLYLAPYFVEINKDCLLKIRCIYSNIFFKCSAKRFHINYINGNWVEGV